MEDNVFTNKLLDIILPDGVLNETGTDSKIKKSNFKHVFLVLEKSERDLKNLLDLKPQLDEEHVIVMLYNLLCSLNYINSTGVIHRDLKPSNILIDCNSQI
jgi:serine/threonine protein kinase